MAKLFTLLKVDLRQEINMKILHLAGFIMELFLYKEIALFRL